MKSKYIFIVWNMCCMNLLSRPMVAQIELQVAFPNLSFSRPVNIVYANDNSGRLFVVEQRGVIHVFQNESGIAIITHFLDIRDRVNDSGNEEGLLGIAFHPDYETNGFFYVDYTASNPRRTVISRFQSSATNPDSADVSSELVLMEVAQPYSNHNGGQITFGPDGYLYIAFGDGGSGGDPDGNGQNRRTLLGSIARIDVDSITDSTNYAIPADNPFVGNINGFREEIYAYGLRNPWRFSFDPVTGWLWAADVGQNQYEEIDIIESGKNYGWNRMEGFHCYNSSNCDTTGLTMPIWEYDHGLGQSVTGGYVYRGGKLPELVGKYIFADYVSGRIWTLEYNGVDPVANELLLNSDLNIASFGVDENNEIYILSFDGRIYTFKHSTTSIPKNNEQVSEFRLFQNYPNPFNPTTTIEYSIKHTNHVELSIINLNGQEVMKLENQVKSPGIYSVQFNAGMLSSGTYYYRLRVDGAEIVKRLTISK
ncbi:PQQ-dependent sugar dehydrogenase [candidate division KSB1 bacterium]|nr:PQQ-dependent sugar dehydrogenase [candidate division KSB1 bacterium]